MVPRVASEIAGPANTFVAEGKGRHDVKEWVGQVQVACAERLEDHLTASELAYERS